MRRTASSIPGGVGLSLLFYFRQQVRVSHGASAVSSASRYELALSVAEIYNDSVRDLLHVNRTTERLDVRAPRAVFSVVQTACRVGLQPVASGCNLSRCAAACCRAPQRPVLRCNAWIADLRAASDRRGQ